MLSLSINNFCPFEFSIDFNELNECNVISYSCYLSRFTKQVQFRLLFDSNFLTDRIDSHRIDAPARTPVAKMVTRKT